MTTKVYIEAGSHDGITGSRSKEFMNDPSYKGILVEPTKTEYLNCNASIITFNRFKINL